jgi:hypothetical protein
MFSKFDQVYLTYLLTYKIGVGEGTFAIHLLVFKITPTKKDR